MNLLDWTQRNGRLLAAILIGTVAIVEGTNASYPSLPEWTGLAVLAALSVSLAGWIAAGKIYDMLPDERGIFLIAFDADNDAGGEIWELSEDQFGDMEIHNGRLLPWSTSSQQVYECRSYDERKNAAVANWRETVAGSELAGHHTASQVMEQIGALRDEFETEAERAKFIRRRLPSIVRKLDRQRAKDQARSLEPHLTPSTENTGSVTEILDDSLPDDLKPEHMTGDELDDEPNESEGWATFDLLDESEAIEPMRND